MKIINKYIYSQFLFFLFIISFIILSIYIIIDITDLIRTNNNITNYYYKIPFILSQIFPAILLFTITLTLSLINKKQITSLIHLIGQPLHKIIYFPLTLILTIIIIAYIFILNYLSPFCLEKYYNKNTNNSYFEDYRFILITAENQYYYTEFDENNNLSEIIRADKLICSNQTNCYLIKPSLIFSKKNININKNKIKISPSIALQLESSNPQLLSTIKIINYLIEFNDIPNKYILESELYLRITLSFLPFFLFLLALVYNSLIKDRIILGLFLNFLIIFVIWLFLSITLNISLKNHIHSVYILIFVWGISLLLCLIKKFFTKFYP